MIFIVVKIRSNISVTNLALLKVQEIQVLVLCKVDLHYLIKAVEFVLATLLLYFNEEKNAQW